MSVVLHRGKSIETGHTTARSPLMTLVTLGITLTTVFTIMTSYTKTLKRSRTPSQIML